MSTVGSSSPPSSVGGPEAELARLIKRAVQAGRRSWCGTTPRAIAAYLISHGVTVPVEREVN